MTPAPGTDRFTAIFREATNLMNADHDAEASRLLSDHAEMLPVDPESVMRLARQMDGRSKIDEADSLVFSVLKATGWKHPFTDDCENILHGDYFPASPDAFHVYDKYFRLRSVNCGGIDVFYTTDLAGGGDYFGQDYLSTARRFVDKVDRLLEWCAGPGFIGFGLMGIGVAGACSFVDVNPKAVQCLKHTARRNGIVDKVEIRHSGTIAAAGFANRFQLVVSNPPMASSIDYQMPPDLCLHQRLAYDIGWTCHEEMYAHIIAHLSDHALLIIQETVGLSHPETFQRMIRDAGLTFVGAKPTFHKDIYYVISRVDAV
jgi:hypothetical protein